MKVRNLTAALALVVSAFVAVPAMANVSTGKLQQDVQSALSSSAFVNVQLENGVATLYGEVNNAMEKNRVRQAALNHPDVDSVVDRLTY